MRKMTYPKLMKMIDDGYAEVNAWTISNDPAIADVTFYRTDGTSRREHVEVTRIPADL